MPSCGTQPGFLLCFLFPCSGKMRDILGNLFFLDFGERCSWKTTVWFFLLFFLTCSSLTGLMAANRLLAKSTQIGVRWMEVQENSSVPIYNYKKDNCNMKRKILKKKFVKCLNIWLSFHYTEKCISLPSFLIDEEKKQLRETEISMAFFLGKWTNVIWNIWNNPSLDFFFCSTCPALPAFILNLILGGRHFYTSSPLLVLFLSLWLETRWQAISIGRCQHLPLLLVLSCFSLLPFQTYSSQYLPVLSKCYCKVFQWDDSKYVYINRGNTLGYILLTFCVVFLYHLPFQLIVIHAQIHILA